ncbi:ABC transporter permease, partial [Escherichia coli]|nr:ABC transporter permease [Escherichia coli]
FIIYKTRFGLRLRSVGEHPLAADTMGIKVRWMRYQGVIISGILGGLGGAVYAQSFTLDFGHATISGQGYM